MNKTFDIAVGPWDKPSIESMHRRPVLRAVFVGGILNKFVIHWETMNKNKKNRGYSDGVYIPVDPDAYQRALTVFTARCLKVVERGPCSMSELEDLHG